MTLTNQERDDLAVEDRRTDIVEVNGDRYAVSYEENTLPGKKDARVVAFDDPDIEFLYNDLESDTVGEVHVVEDEVAEDYEAAIDYLEEEIGTEKDAAAGFGVDGLEDL